MTNILNALMTYKPGGTDDELFEQKLCHQTGWSRPFCQGAILEYKRFLFLTTVSQTPVTPSIFVDEVWHLHLTFSRCYWDELCGKILGRDLHHDPITPNERMLATKQYQHTIELYERHFGTPPNSTYWPVDSTDKDAGNQYLWTLFPSPLQIAFTIFLGVVLAMDVPSEYFLESFFLITFSVNAFLTVLLAQKKHSCRKKNPKKHHREYPRHRDDEWFQNFTNDQDDESGDGGAGCGSGCGAGCGGGC